MSIFSYIQHHLLKHLSSPWNCCGTLVKIHLTVDMESVPYVTLIYVSVYTSYHSLCIL